MDAMLGLGSLTTTFAVVSSTAYQVEQYEGCFAPVFHRVLALREREDGLVWERIGHGAILY